MILEVEAGWLESVRGSLFVYPCAGSDTKHPIAAFCGLCEPIVFVDVASPRNKEIAIPDGFSINRSRSKDRFEQGTEGRSRRMMEWDATSPDGRSSRVEYHVGDAAHFLRALPPRSIGVFMHVRDNPRGEAGSGLHFLSSRVDPEKGVSLMGLLLEKLSDRALVISDGSMSELPTGIDVTTRGLILRPAIMEAGFLASAVGRLEACTQRSSLQGREDILVYGFSRRLS